MIHLIFEKALDEPKYSSMYAQLCRRISKEGSTLEAEGDSRYTFETLLIRVCQDKFVNRSQYSQKIIDSKASEDIEEEELRYIAKQKVLGNVKFIGELFKLEMLNAATLHKMLEQLLDKKSRPYPTLEDRCEDMECLTQIFRTCGRQLDTEKSKNLIDQYFDNMEYKSNSSKYPARIRFMLRDVIELRKDGWKPRKATKVDGPVPIQDLSTDEDYLRQQRNRTMEYQQRNADRNWMDKLPLSLQSMNNYSGTLSMTSSSSLISGPYNPQERGMNNGYNSYNSNSNREPMNRPMNKHAGGGHDGKMNNKFNKQQYNNNMHHRSNQQDRGGWNQKDGGPHHQQNRHDHHNNMHQSKFNQNSYNNNNNNNNNINNLNNLNSNAKELAPRFKRNLVTTTTSPSVDDLQMRPPQNSLLFKASNINKPNPQQLPMNQNQNRSGTSSPGLNNPQVDNLIPAFNSNVQINSSNGFSTQQAQEVAKPPISSPAQPSSPQNNNNNNNNVNVKVIEQIAVTKQGSIEKPKAKKDKGPSRDDVLKKVSQFLSETLFNKSFMDELKVGEDLNGHTNGKSEIIEECEVKSENETEEKLYNEDHPSIKSLDDVVKLYYDLKVPDKFLKDAIVKILNESLDKGDQIHETSIEFLMAMQKDKKLTANQITDALRTVISGMSEREKTIPKVTTHVASLLARSMMKKICKLNDIASFTANGQHYPLLLLVLQQLHKTIGEEQLVEVFNACKVNLMTSLPECDRTKERLAEILDDRKLSFLQPLLRIESELWRQIKEDPQPQTFYKWIKDNVDPIRYTDPGFITALMTVILRFITQVFIIEIKHLIIFKQFNIFIGNYLP